MSKEMTPKEALNQLNNFISREKHIDSERNKTINKCVDTLSQALDYFEQLEKENQELETDKKMLNALYQEVKDTASFYMSKCEKFEKVIEIIKSKNIDIFFLRNNCEFDFKKYNYEIKDNTMQYCYEDCLSLTQQELCFSFFFLVAFPVKKIVLFLCR